MLKQFGIYLLIILAALISKTIIVMITFQLSLNKFIAAAIVYLVIAAILIFKKHKLFNDVMFNANNKKDYITGYLYMFLLVTVTYTFDSFGYIIDFMASIGSLILLDGIRYLISKKINK